MDNRVTLKIEFTPGQQEQMRAEISKAAPSTELKLERLEDRVAPYALNAHVAICGH